MKEETMNSSQITRFVLAAIIGAVTAVTFWPFGMPQAKGASGGRSEYSVIDTKGLTDSRLQGVLNSKRTRGWKVTTGVGELLVLEK